MTEFYLGTMGFSFDDWKAGSYPVTTQLYQRKIPDIVCIPERITP